jgi:cytochrome c oxidase subunit 3
MATRKNKNTREDPMSAPGTFFHLHEEDPIEAYENFKLGMWIFLATEVLLFGGLFAAYFVFKFRYHDLFVAGSSHLKWQLGTLNTVLLLASSYTAALAVDAAQRSRQKALQGNLTLTLLFAAGFLIVKAFEWGPKLSHGMRPGSDIYFSIYYMTTGLHLLHVLVGMFFLALLLVRARKGRYHSQNCGGVEMGALYWHLVDVIWIFLFPLLYLVGGV